MSTQEAPVTRRIRIPQTQAVRDPRAVTTQRVGLHRERHVQPLGQARLRHIDQATLGTSPRLLEDDDFETLSWLVALTVLNSVGDTPSAPHSTTEAEDRHSTFDDARVNPP